MTALNEWTAELKKNEAHAWRRTRAERECCAVRQAFSHFDSTAMGSTPLKLSVDV